MKKSRKRKQALAGMLTAVSILGGIPSPAAAEEQGTALLAASAAEEELQNSEAEVSAGTAETETDRVTAEPEVQEPADRDEEQQQEEPASVSAAVQAAEKTEETDAEADRPAEKTAVSLSVSCSAVDPETGSYTISVKGAALQPGEQILVPVWNDAKQQDIIWNRAVQEGGSYIVRESPAAHGYRTGTYHIHVYKRSSSGAMTFLGNTNVKIQPEAETLSLDQKSTEADALLTGLKTCGTVAEVKAAVWSAVNGQDDLTWETARQQADGTWKANLPLDKHTGTGTYYVHVYAFTKTGQPVFLKKTEFSVDAPAELPLKVYNLQASVSGTSFTLRADRITAPFAVKTVKIAVWSKADQSDIVWYDMAKKGEEYTVTSTTAKHRNNTGRYHAHLYLQGTDGKMHFGSNTDFTVEQQKESRVTVSSVDQDRGRFTITVSPGDSSGISHLQTAVWSTADQSNIKWYRIEKGADGTWKTEMKKENHGNLDGTYKIHAYAVMKDGTMKFLAAATTELKVSSDGRAAVRGYHEDQHPGSFLEGKERSLCPVSYLECRKRTG